MIRNYRQIGGTRVPTIVALGSGKSQYEPTPINGKGLIFQPILTFLPDGTKADIITNDYTNVKLSYNIT